MAAARKKAAAYSDEPSLKEAMSGIHRDKWLEAMRDELVATPALACITTLSSTSTLFLTRHLTPQADSHTLSQSIHHSETHT